MGKDKNNKRHIAIYTIIISSVLLILSMTIIWRYYKKFNIGTKPILYTSDKYNEMSRQMKEKLDDIGIRKDLPIDSFDIRLMTDEWLEAVYYITFRTIDESYWEFAEKYAWKKRDDFSTGEVKTEYGICSCGHGL